MYKTKILLLLLFILSFSSQLCAYEYKHKKVLYLNSYHKGYAWSDNMGMAVEKKLKEHSIRIFYEYLDSKRYVEENYFNQLRELYLHKYKDTNFDLIISGDDNAFLFLKKYRNDVFGDVPVIFCGVNFFDQAELDETTNYTGISEEADIESTIRLALKLHPETETIYLVNDQTTSGRKIHSKLVQFLNNFKSKVKFVLLEDISMTNLMLKLAALPDNSLVYYTLFFKDNLGNVFEYDQSIEMISNASKAPVYGAWDFSLGFGIVGGMLTSSFDQGEKAALVALDVLKGKNVSDIPVFYNKPSQYMFDFNVMKKFKISLSDLPEGSLIINKNQNLLEFYHCHRVQVLRIFIICLIVIIIVVLFSMYKIIRANHKVSASQQRYKTVFESSGTAMIIVREDTVIVRANSNFIKLCGYSKEEIEGKKSWQEFVSVKDKEKMTEYHNKRRSGLQESNFYEFIFVDKDGNSKDILVTVDVIPGTKNSVASLINISKRKKIEAEKEDLIKDLQKTISEVKMLSGLLPICAACKKIRDDKGYWKRIEEYISKHTQAQFSHGICPECMNDFYGKEKWFNDNKETK